MTIRITARRDGFRRCGVAHAATPVEYPDDRFSAEELERLMDEPMLIVELVGEDSAGLKHDGPHESTLDSTGQTGEAEVNPAPEAPAKPTAAKTKAAPGDPASTTQ